MPSEETFEHHSYDVVVIGAGGAGLRAAIAAQDAGARTALICRSLLGKAHTVMAEGGIAAAMGNLWPEDNWEVHFRDTMRGGQTPQQLAHGRTPRQGISRPGLRTGAMGRLVRPHRGRQDQPARLRWSPLRPPGSRRGPDRARDDPRPATAGCLARDGRVHGVAPLPSLLKDGDRITGAFGYWRESGRFVVLEAPAVILATGGIGKSWKVTSNSWECTGDGHALALRSGATLLNMEFVQFHPTGMVWPLSVRGLLVTESVRGDGGVLLNSEQRRFMFDYIPEFFKAETADNIEEADRWYTDKRNNRRPPELLPRDEVARAINSEIKAGRGSPHGGVFLDIASRRSPDFIKKALALHVPAVPGAGRCRHHQGSDGNRPHVPLRHGRGRGRR